MLLESLSIRTWMTLPPIPDGGLTGSAEPVEGGGGMNGGSDACVGWNGWAGGGCCAYPGIPGICTWIGMGTVAGAGPVAGWGGMTGR